MVSLISDYTDSVLPLDLSKNSNSLSNEERLLDDTGLLKSVGMNVLQGTFLSVNKNIFILV